MSAVLTSLLFVCLSVSSVGVVGVSDQTGVVKDGWFMEVNSQWPGMCFSLNRRIASHRIRISAPNQAQVRMLSVRLFADVCMRACVLLLV